MIADAFIGIRSCALLAFLGMSALANPEPVLTNADPSESHVSSTAEAMPQGGRKIKGNARRSSTIPASVPFQADPIAGYVLEVNPPGRLRVMRKTAKVPTLAELGTPLYSEDTLELTGPAKAIGPPTTASVICNNHKTPYRLKIGTEPCPCQAGAATNSSRSVSVRPARGPVSKGVPILLSPRMTSLVNVRPTVRWEPIEDANPTTTYRVSIYAEGRRPVWSGQVSGKAELPFPSDARSLDPDVYFVIIETGDHSSREDLQQGIGFKVLGKQEAHAVHLAEERVRKLGLPEVTTRVLLAILYAEKKIYAEAIEQLEALPEEVKTESIVRMLGRLYATIGLYSRAEKVYSEIEKRYEIALKNPQDTHALAEDLEGQAKTKEALAGTYELPAKKAETIAKLEEALRIFERLGDSTAIERIKQLLVELTHSSN